MLGSGAILLTQVLNGLAYGMLLFLVAAGLSVIFGLMDVLNLSHGSFYMLGAYVGLTIVRSAGNFWLALLLAPVLVGCAGFLVERLLLRPLYGRGHLDQVLLTLGVAYVAQDQVHWAWGADIHAIPAPPSLAGSVSILGSLYPTYRLFVIGFGAVVAVALWLLLDRTRWGARIRAGVADRTMVRNLGIDISRVFAVTFSLGCALAAMAGVVAGPILGVYLGMDLDVLILSLAIVVLGGLGSFVGSFWGSLLIGQADTFGRVLFPEFSMFLIFVLVAAVLLTRPAGLFRRGVA